jgi:hypothetical protein
MMAQPPAGVPTKKFPMLCMRECDRGPSGGAQTVSLP